MLGDRKRGDGSQHDTSETRGSTKSRLHSWLKKQRDELIDMNRRNRLLYFQHTKTSSLEITTPTPSDLLSRLNRGGAANYWTFYLPSRDTENDDQPPRRDPSPTDLVVAGKDRPGIEKALHLIERNTSQAFVDKGLWILYLALGMLEWKESDDDNKTVSSPLLLVPVTIGRDSLREPFRLRRTDDDAVINPTLLVKLGNDFDLSLPADELADSSIEGVLDAVTQAIRGREGWSVSNRAVLTTFTFQKEAMHRDLLDNVEQIIENPLIEVLALGPDAPRADTFGFEPIDEDQLDRVSPPEDMVSVRDADATQRRCILAARDGHSFVMDGPPGSGKSQTITNMIAELMHAGKTVLFVSEKIAALDVVYNRLKAAKLDDFALQLHSHKATRKAVAAELGKALASRPVAHSAFSQSTHADLIKRRTALSSYAQAMNVVRQPLGRSLHQVLGAVAALHANPQAPVPNGFGLDLSPETISSILDTAANLGRAWAPVERGDDVFLWRELRDPTLSAARRGEIEKDLDKAAMALTTLQARVGLIDSELGLGWYDGPTDAERLLDLLVLLDDRPVIPLEWLCADGIEDVEHRSRQLAGATEAYRLAVRNLHDSVGAEAVDIDPNQRRAFTTAIDGLTKASNSIQLQVPWLPDRNAQSAALRHQARFLSDSVEVLEQLNSDSRHIAKTFGLASANISIQRAIELADLGTLVNEPARPEAHWLDPFAQASLDEAMQVLGNLVSEFRTRRHALHAVFTDEALNLGLRAIQVRFTEVHRGLGKLRRAYREDKATLASCTLTGKVDRQVLAMLPDGVAWKEGADQLSLAETRHADILGEHYYQRSEADFAKIAQALNVARRAITLASGERVGPGFADQLARGSASDPAIPFLAERARRTATTWTMNARDVLGPVVDRLSSVSLVRARTWCIDALANVQAVIALVDEVSAIAGRQMSVEETRTALDSAAAVYERRATVESEREADQQLIGDRFAGVDTDWVSVTDALAWTCKVRRVVDGALTGPVAEALAESPYTSADLSDQYAAWEKASARIATRFDDSRTIEMSDDLRGDFDDVEHVLEQLKRTVGDIDTWAAYSTAKSKLEQMGLEPVVTFCRDERVPGTLVRPIVERAVLEAWTDAVFNVDYERLAVLRAEDRDALVDEFRKLDALQVDSAAARIINACTNRRPTSSAGQAGIIKRQGEIQRKHMPIRELLTQAGGVAQLLKPCFMMSPLSVSQFLPSSLRFDVVIFDEASQVRPSDAVNCVYRGAQLIVAGDQKQLPPTSFFAGSSAANDDEYDEEQIDEFESVLDLCKATGALAALPLQWHYRSQHESLITYSNYKFYGGDLHTFPGATQEATDVGIELFKVDGVYRRGGARDNPIEAIKVVERIRYHRLNHPELTLGVVTFSGAQEDAIQRELERQAQLYPELADLTSDDRLDGFFVKNLENVQGDERDIIIFSIGYGFDEHGKFTMQVASLNRRGSERRLNVAITRAKRRVEIVTSVLAEDFSGTATAGAMLHLPRYLDFAKRGMPALAADVAESLGDVESPFEDEVVRTIRSWGFDAVPQVGVAGYRVDIGIRHLERPGLFVLGVECDGAMYHSSKVARDRDRLRQQVLEGLGWTIHRIWGPTWYRNRAEQEVRLRDAIDDAIRGHSTRPTIPTKPMESVSVQEVEVDFDAVPLWSEPYRLAELDAQYTGYDMHEPEARPQLQRLVEEVARQEGPVHRDRVLRAVRIAWGVGRAGPRIKDAFDSAVRALGRKALDVDAVGFLRLESSTLSKVRVPTDDPESRREAKHVPQAELQLAIAHLVSDAHAITRDEVSVRVARLFGWSRRGPDVTAALDRAIEILVRNDLVISDDQDLRSAHISS